jgi:hypothetical protein
VARGRAVFRESRPEGLAALIFPAVDPLRLVRHASENALQISPVRPAVWGSKAAGNKLPQRRAGLKMRRCVFERSRWSSILFHRDFVASGRRALSSRAQSGQREKFTATSDCQGRRFQPRSYGRTDRNPPYRSFDGAAMRRGEESAHRLLHLGFSDRAIIATGRQREGLRQNSFQRQGEINQNPFHSCIVKTI